MDNPGTAGDDDLVETLAGACVECNGDADCADGLVCDPWRHTCFFAGGKTGQCEGCRADADCAPNSRCVEVRFPRNGDAHDVVGTYCAVDCGTLGDPTNCADVAAGGNVCGRELSRSGVAVDACLPATTTCEAYQRFGFACQASDGACSHDGARGDQDGTCVSGQCTYPCDGPEDCPGVSCVEDVCDA